MGFVTMHLRYEAQVMAKEFYVEALKTVGMA